MFLFRFQKSFQHHNNTEANVQIVIKKLLKGANYFFISFWFIPTKKNEQTSKWMRNTYILMLLFTIHNVLRLGMDTILCIWSPLILRVNYKRWLVFKLKLPRFDYFLTKTKSNINLSNKQKIPETWSHSILLVHSFIYSTSF